MLHFVDWPNGLIEYMVYLDDAVSCIVAQNRVSIGSQAIQYHWVMHPEIEKKL